MSRGKRKYKPKFKKFAVGSIYGNIARGIQAGNLQKEFGADRARTEAEIEAFDKSKLQMKGSSTIQKMLDQPISQSLVEAQTEAQKATEATAMAGAQKAGAKGVQAGLQAILQSGQQADLARMKEQQSALTAAQKSKAAEEGQMEDVRRGLATEELKGMQTALKEAREGELASKMAKQQAFVSAGEQALNQVGKAATAGMAEKGMITPKKGKPQVSEGDFDHKKNPIDIMDKGGVSDMKQDGEKVGELTGGEAIFNPEDTKKMQDLVDSKDAEGLMEHMTMLFERFEKDDLEHMEDEAEEQMANKGIMYKESGKIPSKMKGFSKLPESVQEKMSPELAKKYMGGGSYRPKFKFKK
jgi:hypothetical protein